MHTTKPLRVALHRSHVGLSGIVTGLHASECTCRSREITGRVPHTQQMFHVRAIHPEGRLEGVIAAAMTDLNRTFASGHTRSIAWRRSQLAALQTMLLTHREQWSEALQRDLGKSAYESWTTEISQVTAEIEHIRANLAVWMRGSRARTPLSLRPARSSVRYDPYGTVLIIAPWNYPLQLMLSPLAGAIAGGNCVILKPSEVSTHVEALTAELVPQYLDPAAIRVVTGGAEVAQRLIALEPDKVFFTGSPTVGAKVATQCAERLIPVTLELGGKSPVYVHRDANLTSAARRIVWGKFLNAGQTCTAPDHVYVDRAVQRRFVRALQREIRRQYGRDPRRSPDFGRIITSDHTRRLARLIEPYGETQVVAGGEVDEDARYMAPTVLFPVTEDHPTMREEIFGPVLPILPVDSPRTAIDAIRQREKPLALYLFTKRRGVRDAFLTEVQSGGVAINATIIQIATPHLPFGGVGPSGWGSYHGAWSFRAFTHERGVIDKPNRPETLRVAMPPTGRVKRSMVEYLLPGGSAPRRDLKLARTINRRNR